MAAALRHEFSNLLRISNTCQSVAVRWKKIPKWRDPRDISWAAPLLEKMKQREESGKGDAEQTPAMLHMVTRVRRLKGRPYWEKETLEKLGLGAKVGKNVPVVHKNTPNVNSMLASVKHLVKIVPVTFPHGLPSDESDFHHSVLLDNGQLEVKRRLQPLESCLTDTTEEKVWQMDEETVELQTRRIKELFSLSSEYFPAKYVYKYNEDGKEYRYHGNQNIGGDRDWY